MPYKIKKFKGGYKVCKKKGGKCFSKKPMSKKKAKAQMAAIQMNEKLSSPQRRKLLSESDRRIRELERLAKTGDLDAKEQLKRLISRSGLDSYAIWQTGPGYHY